PLRGRGGGRSCELGSRCVSAHHWGGGCYVLCFSLLGIRGHGRTFPSVIYVTLEDCSTKAKDGGNPTLPTSGHLCRRGTAGGAATEQQPGSSRNAPARTSATPPLPRHAATDA